MKIGLDIHGVIDAHRFFFAQLTNLLKCSNEDGVALGYDAPHEIHIMTGPSKEKLKPDELEGIHFTHFFSIVDHCKQSGVAVVHDEKGNPWMDQYEWNRAKGDYARKHELDLVLDDSVIYPEFFSTPIATFQSRQNWKQGKK